VLRVGTLELDRSTRRVLSEGSEIDLSTREFDLLAYFMEHRGEVLARDRILNAVWGVSFYGMRTTSSLRPLPACQLGDPERRLIQTVRRVGYRLADD